MKELSLKIKCAKRIMPTVEVNGKVIKCKKNQFGNFECNTLIDKDTADIKIYRYLEINSKLWWFISIFYYIISIFGIFDPIKEKSNIVINCHIKIDMSKSESFNLEFDLNDLQTQNKAFEIISNCEFEEFSNNYYLDKKAKKRRKFLTFSKIVIFIGAIIGLAFLIKNIINF